MSSIDRHEYPHSHSRRKRKLASFSAFAALLGKILILILILVACMNYWTLLVWEGKHASSSILGAPKTQRKRSGGVLLNYSRKGVEGRLAQRNKAQHFSLASFGHHLSGTTFFLDNGRYQRIAQIDREWATLKTLPRQWTKRRMGGRGGKFYTDRGRWSPLKKTKGMKKELLWYRYKFCCRNNLCWSFTCLIFVFELLGLQSIVGGFRQ